MAAPGVDLFPCPSRDTLEKAFVGKNLSDVQAPLAVVDRAVVKRNCSQMLEACQALGVGFRPHVKTHKHIDHIAAFGMVLETSSPSKTDLRRSKTIEATLLQIGDAVDGAKLVVSTMAEAEHLADLLQDLSARGRSPNVLYGVPLAPSQVHRLAMLGNKIGPQSVSILVDNSSQLGSAHIFKQATGVSLQVFVKVDLGYHRAGLDYTSKAFDSLIKDIFLHEEHGFATLVGFYTHAGHSYGGESDIAAVRHLMEEIKGLYKAAIQVRSRDHACGQSQPRYTLSVGATPTATSIQNFLPEARGGQSGEIRGLISKAKELIKRVNQRFLLEIHAGVYTFLDMQQLATKASPSAHVEDLTGQRSKKSTADVALTIMAEVASLYGDRESPEALIAAGSLALGREACKSYSGWGVVSDWGMGSKIDGEGRSGWQVGRISQEHGILTKDFKSNGNPMELTIGQRIRIWPNHACVAGAGFGWYLIVDSDLPEDRRDEIVDVWVRWRGW